MGTPRFQVPRSVNGLVLSFWMVTDYHITAIVLQHPKHICIYIESDMGMVVIFGSSPNDLTETMIHIYVYVGVDKIIGCIKPLSLWRNTGYVFSWDTIRYSHEQYDKNMCILYILFNAFLSRYTWWCDEKHGVFSMIYQTDIGNHGYRTNVAGVCKLGNAPIRIMAMTMENRIWLSGCRGTPLSIGDVGCAHSTQNTLHANDIYIYIYIL